MIELILGVISVILVILIIFLLRQNAILKQQTGDLAMRTSDWAIKQSNNLVQNAQQQANTLLTNAELESLKLANEKRIEVMDFEEIFKQKLDSAVSGSVLSLNNTFKTLESQMLNNMNQAQKAHVDFLSKLEESASSEQREVIDRMSTKINELLFNFEQNMSNFLANTEQKSLDAINLEVRSARQMIDSYKSQQLSIVDENIVAVLERTLSLILKEKLSLKNQLDLVYESLDKAKVEKFFA